MVYSAYPAVAEGFKTTNHNGFYFILQPTLTWGLQIY